MDKSLPQLLPVYFEDRTVSAWKESNCPALFAPISSAIRIISPLLNNPPSATVGIFMSIFPDHIEPSFLGFLGNPPDAKITEPTLNTKEEPSLTRIFNPFNFTFTHSKIKSQAVDSYIISYSKTSCLYG